MVFVKRMNAYRQLIAQMNNYKERKTKMKIIDLDTGKIFSEKDFVLKNCEAEEKNPEEFTSIWDIFEDEYHLLDNRFAIIGDNFKTSNKKIPFSTCKNLMDSISALAPYAGITNVSEIEEYTRSVFLDIMEVWEKENNAKWEIILD